MTTRDTMQRRQSPWTLPDTSTSPGTSWNGYSQEDYATVKYQQASGIEEERRARDGFEDASQSVFSRDWLFIPPSVSGNPHSVITLLGISGRKAASLRTGANDISRLSPGVYFLRQGPDGRAVKVVVQR